MQEVGKSKVKSAVTGAVSGVVNGFFGGGGGLLLVPLLKRFVGCAVKTAHATAIAIAVMMSVSTCAIYLCNGVVTFGDAVWYMAGGAVGGLAGGLLLGKIPKKWLRKAFALFLIFMAARMILNG